MRKPKGLPIGPMNRRESCLVWKVCLVAVTAGTSRYNIIGLNSSKWTSERCGVMIRVVVVMVVLLLCCRCQHHWEAICRTGLDHC